MIINNAQLASYLAQLEQMGTNRKKCMVYCESHLIHERRIDNNEIS